MGKVYKGPIRLRKLSVDVNVEGNKATTKTEYLFNNTARTIQRLRLDVTRPGLSMLKARRPTIVRPIAPTISTGDMKKVKGGSLSARLAPRSDLVVDLDTINEVLGDVTKAISFLPNISSREEEFAHRLDEYYVRLELPVEAKKVIASSVKPTKVTRSGSRLICEFKQSDVYPIAFYVKWTEVDVPVTVKKKVRHSFGNKTTVTIIVKNMSDKALSDLAISEDYPEDQAIPAPRQTALKWVNHGEKSRRLSHKVSFSLNAYEEKTLRYTIIRQGIGASIPATSLFKSGVLVGVAEAVGFVPIPVQPAPPKAAFVLPSGWSFNFKHGGDHHINEHGMWCSGQNYNEHSETLHWSTGTIYADKNFDDDYYWSVNHQVVRFNPGYCYHGNTPWLAKSGRTTTHNGTFQNDDLKQFNNAVVLIRGWRFDFTSSDHHINQIMLWIDNVRFDRNRGRVNWRTRVRYADKNWDDNYRYLYYYTILGFNGTTSYINYSGTDRGGSAAHAGHIQQNTLKNYKDAMLFPMGWKFDYKSSDHHIDQNNFKLQNVIYSKSTGRVSWTAHLKYSDRNADDDYNWSYRVLALATNAGESREYSAGPYLDNGGVDSKSYNRNLEALFVPITWNNGIMDGDETGVDCGGSSPAKNMNCCRSSVNPGNSSSSGFFNLKNINEQNVVRSYAQLALFEYANNHGFDYNTLYSGAEEPDRYVEAIAWYVDQHMEYVSDSGIMWSGSQSAIKTLLYSGHRGSKQFAGDCEDHAILRAALLRSLGMSKYCVFCADHHNSVDQGQDEECYGEKKGSGGHTFNIVIYKGKYRILDYGSMRCRNWANKAAWKQHVVDNIWNDHTGKHWSKQDVSPFGSIPLVNYPGNPSSPTSNWDWRTYFCDITP